MVQHTGPPSAKAGSEITYKESPRDRDRRYDYPWFAGNALIELLRRNSGSDLSQKSRYLQKKRWLRSWTRKADNLDGAQRTRASEIIGRINDVMNELGRPFGHQMGQASHNAAARRFGRNTDIVRELIAMVNGAGSDPNIIRKIDEMEE